VRKCEKQLCRHQGQRRRRRRRRCFKRRSRDSPAAHREDNGNTGCASVAHGGPQWSRYPPAAHGGPHARVSGCALKEILARGKEPMQERVFWQELHPVARIDVGEVREGLCPVGVTLH